MQSENEPTKEELARRLTALLRKNPEILCELKRRIEEEEIVSWDDEESGGSRGEGE